MLFRIFTAVAAWSFLSGVCAEFCDAGEPLLSDAVLRLRQRIEVRPRKDPPPVLRFRVLPTEGTVWRDDVILRPIQQRPLNSGDCLVCPEAVTDFRQTTLPPDVIPGSDQPVTLTHLSVRFPRE